MDYYGFTITDKGRALITKLLVGETLQLSRIMFGSGGVPADSDIAALTDLVTPVAAGTSSKPLVKGGAASMVLEYRTDLNGGLERGFWLREFGVFAYDPDEGEVMIYYGTLGGYPQWCSPYGDGTGIDVRRFPITIAIGEDRGIAANYPTGIWMTAEDVHSYFEVNLMPIVRREIDRHIATHNTDATSHPYLISLANKLDSRISLLELMFNTNVAENQFMVTFESLDTVNTAGNWNKDAARMEF